MHLERSLKRRDQPLKLSHRETGQIEHFDGVSLELGEPQIAHSCDLLAWEAQDIINRD
jgi:hypothetical protein